MVALFSFFSCSTVDKDTQQQLSSDKFYKRDMIIHVNGQEGIGTLVAGQADKYLFHIEASGELDLFTFKSCHREWSKQKAWNVETYKRQLFWKKKIVHKKQIKFEIELTELEKSRYCPVLMVGVERIGGRHSWGFVDFISKVETLPATLYCNGEKLEVKGVSICQTKNGLKQKITFKNEVSVVEKPGCAKMQTSDNKSFFWETTLKECPYPFVENGSGEVHRLTTIGYESIFIRKE